MIDEPENARERDLPPKELQPTIDALVSHALGEGPEPEDVDLLYDWLNDAGWDALIADLGDEMALKIDYLADLHFNDGEYRATVGKEEAEPVTDAERVAYVRKQIATIQAGQGDDYFYPSLHTYPLTDRQGRHAVLGCTIDIHGQAGPVPDWDGVFISREAYLSYLAEHGFWLATQIETLKDEEILAKWSA